MVTFWNWEANNRSHFGTEKQPSFVGTCNVSHNYILYNHWKLTLVALVAFDEAVLWNCTLITASYSAVIFITSDPCPGFHTTVQTVAMEITDIFDSRLLLWLAVLTAWNVAKRTIVTWVAPKILLIHSVFIKMYFLWNNGQARTMQLNL